jgi:FKBP-type peptidyl-prolyl cis-trans isomerase
VRFARPLLLVLLALTAAACGEDTPSGPSSLTLEEITVGTGATAVTGDTVNVYYTGAFLDGRVFDSLTSGTPLSFRIGAAAVIPGFEQGVVGMKVGGKRRVTIPADLAYGSSGRGSIPPNTPLRFEIELVSIAGK